MSHLQAVLTIGVYGWTPDTFMAALALARCDAVADIRARRGVRGAQHAFANRQRLEAMLTASGIVYLHLPELAPTAETRALQRREDDETGTAKRDRTGLHEDFVRAYGGQLELLDAAALAERLGGSARRPALLCVESRPAACHRGLAASYVAHAAGVEVADLVP